MKLLFIIAIAISLSNADAQYLMRTYKLGGQDSLQPSSNAVSQILISNGQVFLATNKGLNIATNGGSLIKTDFGKNGPTGISVNAIAIEGDTIVTAVSSDTSVGTSGLVGKGLFASTDDGTTWTREPQSLDSHSDSTVTFGKDLPRPLLDEVASRIDRTVLETIAQEISDATDAVTETTEVSGLADEITSRITDMVGSSHALEMTLGFSPTEPDRLLRALRLFIDDGKRGVGDASLGSANLLYLALKALELEQLVEKKKRDHTFLAIEEPEAHLHPHLQRLVYRDFLRRRTHQEAGAKGEAPLLATSILMTTHSPHIVSVSPLKSIILLRKAADEDSSEGLSAAEVELEEDEREDLERYLDVSRGEMLFAKGVLLVEGEAEMYVVPALGKLIGYDFDELGITVCSVAGTNFAPYVKLLRPNGLNIPFAVLTDFDPQDEGKNLGEKRVLNLLQNVVPAKKLGGKETAELLKLAPQKGLFLNEYTFEVDLFKCGRHESMCKTLSDLTEFKKVVERAEEWKNDPSKLDPERFLGDIEKIGKGRFAQRLAGNMTGKLCPVYIKEAIEYVVNLCH